MVRKSFKRELMGEMLRDAGRVDRRPARTVSVPRCKHSHCRNPLTPADVDAGYEHCSPDCFEACDDD